MLTSRVTKHGRTTIPRAVREALDLEVGARLVFELQGDHVLLRSASQPFHDPFVTFDTWAGAEDARAYVDL